MQITKTNLEQFINELIKSGKPVVAPIRENNLSAYKPINSFNQINLDLPFPTKSAKEYFLADYEKILSYSFGEKGQIEMKEPDQPKELILFGVRPCEAASFPIMNKVFSWDSQDKFYQERLAKNLVITVACEQSDDFCFCTSVGLSPQATDGSDIFMRKTQTGDYLAEGITDKGKNLIEKHKDLFNENSNEKPIDYKGPEKKFDLKKIKPWLEKNFEHPMWNQISLPCIGCGVCTFTCPNCYCFDMVDEATLKEGARYKMWDSCQFRMFTVHASGHNPRDNQSKRFRQRIEHKFNYYPDKFDHTLCVGCGRCIRHCPADMSLLETLITINKLT
ncbi:MAG: 4Fe-4S dicluster domain-containing protein [Planctomycetes bacterium]|nr:4Fe-4S dicluster domain-containing protein [Planctomycetota bacterium]